jgi:hypothetical protein
MKLGLDWASDAATVLAMSVVRKVLMKQGFDGAVIRFANRGSVIFKRQK